MSNSVMVEAFSISAREKARIAQQFLAVCPASAANRPVVHAMAGMPGAGKSSFVRHALETGLFLKTAFVHNPDRVIREIEAYNAMVQSHGLEAAFAAFELPARALAQEIVWQAAEKTCDIVVDMGHVRQENWDLLAALKNKGYRVEMHVVFTPLAQSLARLQARAGTQFYPTEQAVSRAQALAGLLQMHAALPHGLHVYDNAESTVPFALCPNTADALKALYENYTQKTLCGGA